MTVECFKTPKLRSTYAKTRTNTNFSKRIEGIKEASGIVSIGFIVYLQDGAMYYEKPTYHSNESEK